MSRVGRIPFVFTIMKLPAVVICAGPEKIRYGTCIPTRGSGGRHRPESLTLSPIDTHS